MDNEGRQYLILDEIIDYQKTADQITVPRKIVQQQTTKGWNLCILWKDGLASWEPLKDTKAAFPVQVA